VGMESTLRDLWGFIHDHRVHSHSQHFLIPLLSTIMSNERFWVRAWGALALTGWNVVIDGDVRVRSSKKRLDELGAIGTDRSIGLKMGVRG